MVSLATMDLDRIREAAATVVDPEIPVLTVEDLGILRFVEAENDRVVVTVTPTYSGCPAMTRIAEDIADAVIAAGASEVEVRTVYSPPWTTDWISEEGREKLARFGIAPPSEESEVVCPRCSQGPPRLVSFFGATACQALMTCRSCGEPFSHFRKL